MLEGNLADALLGLETVGRRGVDGGNAVDGLVQLCSRTAGVGDSCVDETISDDSSIAVKHDDIPCISGASSAREKEPMRMAKKTLTTSPAVAERGYGQSTFAFDQAQQ